MIPEIDLAAWRETTSLFSPKHSLIETDDDDDDDDDDNEDD